MRAWPFAAPAPAAGSGAVLSRPLLLLLVLGGAVGKETKMADLEEQLSDEEKVMRGTGAAQSSLAAASFLPLLVRLFFLLQPGAGHRQGEREASPARPYQAGQGGGSPVPSLPRLSVCLPPCPGPTLSSTRRSLYGPSAENRLQAGAGLGLQRGRSGVW